MHLCVCVRFLKIDLTKSYLTMRFCLTVSKHHVHSEVFVKRKRITSIHRRSLEEHEKLKERLKPLNLDNFAKIRVWLAVSLVHVVSVR